MFMVNHLTGKSEATELDSGPREVTELKREPRNALACFFSGVV